MTKETKTIAASSFICTRICILLFLFMIPLCIFLLGGGKFVCDKSEYTALLQANGILEIKNLSGKITPENKNPYKVTIELDQSLKTRASNSVITASIYALAVIEIVLLLALCVLSVAPIWIEKHSRYD